MIRYAEPEHLPQLLDFLERDSLGVKIAGTLLAYGLSRPFADCWFQLDRDEKMVAVIGRLDVALTLCTAPRLSRDEDARIELASFCRMLPGIESLTCSEDSALEFPFSERGFCLELQKAAALPFSAGEETPLLPLSPSALYALLDSCRAPAIVLPPRMAFIADFSHRLRHGAARCWGLSDGSPAAAVFTAAETGARALIGGVATRPDCRNRGYASRLLHTVCETLRAEGKTPSLFCLEPELPFYEARGFVTAGRWASAKFIDEKDG